MASRDVVIPADGIRLSGDLAIPDAAKGLVIFAHGSGSSRHSPRNTMVARSLRDGGLGTLLFDLLTEDEGLREDAGATRRFDIPMLANRLEAAAAWCRTEPEARRLRIGYFGASTGAAAALVAAAARPEAVQAVVSRGGRPDLAGPSLSQVQAPTLLLVGGNDGPVINMNREAYDQLRCVKEMRIIPGATHLFEEPGTLEAVSRMAGDWFLHHFGGPAK
jgi:putative phosphoribosyl transferase